MSEDKEAAIEKNLQQVRKHILEACARAGRDRNEVTLVAVSKTRSIKEIELAYDCGVRHFGENRVEEAESKVPQLRKTFAADPVTWHMIGHVQSRKAERAIACSDIIHSVESPSLIRRLDRFAADREEPSPILIEVNVSGESSKYGWPAWDDETCEELIEKVQVLASKEHLQVRGLMTMAPFVDDPEEVRPIFQRMRRVRDLLRERAAFSPWDELSMGMTNDYEVAVEEGATIVRIGRAIFGAADYF